MAIKVGDRLPDATFTRHDARKARSRKPPTRFSRARRWCCSRCPAPSRRPATRTTCPAFVNNADAIKAKGIDTIAVTGVNDVFVMDAWKKATGADGKIEFLADGSGDFAKAIGLAADLRHGLGTRSQRYAMVVDDGVVKTLNVEDAPGKAEISGADNLLQSFRHLRAASCARHPAPERHVLRACVPLRGRCGDFARSALTAAPRARRPRSLRAPAGRRARSSRGRRGP